MFTIEKGWDGMGIERSAVIQIGRYPSAGPSRYIRFRVTADHSRAMSRRTQVHLELGRNRIWIVDLKALMPQYRE